jgi:SHS2 domain-containing protein
MVPAARVRRYASFPTTADVGIRASAPDPDGLFEALGLGLFALMTDLRTVRPAERRQVSARGSDLPALVVAYLTELLLLEQDDGFVARAIHANLTGRPPTAVRAELLGEPIDPARHPRHEEVKAITWHRLVVGLDPPRARVIVDI